MVTLIDEFRQKVSSGLKRRSIVTPSKWAETYRIMSGNESGPWSFKRRPYLRALHDSEAEVNVIRKCAQIGLSETALNVLFFNLDIHKRDALYVLPSKGDARDFSAGRLDPAIELSPHIERLFSDTKNVGHKRAGPANLYIRGGKSSSGLKTIPVSVLILDELDEMSKRAVALALERQSGQTFRLTWMISTPTVEDYGVSKQYELSTQEHYYFKCPLCSREITFKYPESIEICGESETDPDINKSHLKCYRCNKRLEHENRWEYLDSGIWVPDYKSRLVRGFALNQLFSPTVTPGQFAASYFKAQYDPADAQEFWNSKCGLPYVAPGGRLTDDEISQCFGNYTNGQIGDWNLCRTIGIDVGAEWLHYEVDEWTIPGGSPDINRDARCRVVEQGKVRQFEELDRIIERLGVHFGVVDAMPERRKAYELCTRHYGRMAICFYSPGQSSRAIILNEEELTVKVDRTSWLELSLNRFRNKTIQIPSDASLEYRDQLTALVKRYEKDAVGNPTPTFVAVGPDHFAHARNYSEIALGAFLPSASTSYNMESIL